MRKLCLYVTLLLTIGMFTQCGNLSKKKGFVVHFNSEEEISGEKFAIKDIAPDLPLNWDDYNYVVLEFKITTPQRFHVGFNTDDGYNELRVMSYTANGWNKLAIPLKFYRQLPGAASDLAATYNQPRYTGWVNLGGTRGPLHGVDSIGFRMRVPIGNPELEIRSISLSVDDPGDEYLGTEPVVDEFGQWNLADYEGKIHSMEELKQAWDAEEAETITTEPYQYSKYGGYLQSQVKATGFFRTEKVDGRWWFVDPEGHLFLSVGVDCVNPGGGGMVRDVEKRANMYKELPPKELMGNSPRAVPSFGQWNLYRRYGEAYDSLSKDRVIKRMDQWGLNTIANWSNADIMKMNQKAFIVQLRGTGIEPGLMGLTDVYAPDFASKLDKAIGEFVLQYKNNPWLIGYFIANEPAWLEQEDRLCSMILEGNDRPIKRELQKQLTKGDTPELRKEFIYNTFHIFLSTIDQTLKRYDPNHLNLGIRFGNILALNQPILEICKQSFDVLSFNCYDLTPKKEMLDYGLELTDLPMIIGEYHFGTVDRGMAQSLWQVDSQKERGVAYRYYTEQAYAHPGVVGTAYFQWCDQDLTGRFDGENYNCGLVDVTDRPYKYQVEAMMETAKVLYNVHSGAAEPYAQQPLRARGHGGMPGAWK